MNIVEEPDQLIVGEGGINTFLIGAGAFIIIVMGLILIGTIKGGNSGKLTLGILLFESPFFLIGLLLLRKPLKHRYIFDRLENEYIFESKSFYGAKRIASTLDQIQSVQVSTWEKESDERSDFSVYRVTLIFHEESFTPDKRFSFLWKGEYAAYPLQIATRITAFLSLPEPKIVKIDPSDEFFANAGNWLNKIL